MIPLKLIERDKKFAFRLNVLVMLLFLEGIPWKRCPFC